MSGYILPPYSQNDEGRQRSVGFELEFGNLQVAEVAAIVADTFAGESTKKSDMEYIVSGADTGDFAVELDWQLGKKIAEERRSETSSDEDDTLLAGMKMMAEQIVPVEIVCPPIQLGNLDQLDTLVDRLRAAGAKGTDESFLYAFGVHINPEVPNAQPATLVRFLQAFCLCQKWLTDKSSIDPIRKITPYIKPYPEKYITVVLGYSEDLSLEGIIDDYFRHNATRNRALDMLPLWKHLQPESFDRNDFDDTLTQARPTFHYRLPNCEIDKEGWYLSSSWNLWCVVEHLANDRSLLNQLIEQYEEEREKGFFAQKMTWHNQLEQIHSDLS